jgi:hypothetical protein
MTIGPERAKRTAKMSIEEIGRKTANGLTRRTARYHQKLWKKEERCLRFYVVTEPGFTREKETPLYVRLSERAGSRKKKAGAT